MTTDTAELAGYPGKLEQDLDPDDLPESFEWRTGPDLLDVPLDEAARELEARIDEAMGSPLALAGRHDVLVDIASVVRDDDGLLVVLRERSGTSALTDESATGGP